MRKRDTLPVLGSLLVLALALCLWEWAAKTGEIDIFFFSSPSLVWDTLLSQMSSGLLIRHLAVTLKGTTANLSLDHLANEVDHLLQNIIILRTNNDAGLSLQPALEKLNSAYKASCDAIAEVYAS